MAPLSENVTMRIKLLTAVAVLLCVTLVRNLVASEYLGNNQRTAYTDAVVPTKPALLWTYKERHASTAGSPKNPRRDENTGFGGQFRCGLLDFRIQRW